MKFFKTVRLLLKISPASTIPLELYNRIFPADIFQCQALLSNFKTEEIMKKLVLFLLLGGIIGFSGVSVFAQCDRVQLSHIQCGYYNEGYEDGISDARSRQDSDYRRYRNKLDSRLYERYYIQGYDAGYVSVRPPRGDFPSPNFPGGGRGRGTATGTVSWSGRVDNRVNIVIRGDEITNQTLAGTFRPGYQSMNGVLPRRNATVSVIKIEGRGTALVIQQPARNNNFTAIVQVSDPRRSDDEYRLEIRWQAGNAEERYSPGRVTWRGRVDATVDVIISGSDVESVDRLGSGLTNVNFNINGYLAARPGSVAVRKRSGRGSVTIIQQPNRENNFEAIVRIFDPDRSDDEYEIEITW